MTSDRYQIKEKDFCVEILDDGIPMHYSTIVNRLNALHEENQRLKQTMKEVKELLIEEVDIFSDEATEHDINAYIELQEFDNKDAYYLATSTKKAIKMLRL